jgi:DNA-directed RNA polymerase subunit E'/Rpb7
VCVQCACLRIYLAAQLAELLEVVQREVVAGEVQHGVQQGTAVTVGQHETVTVGPPIMVLYSNGCMLQNNSEGVTK